MELSLFTRLLMILISDRDRGRAVNGTSRNFIMLEDLLLVESATLTLTLTLTAKNLLRHYANQAFKHSEIGALSKIVKFCEVPLTSLQRHDTRDIFTETLDTDEEARSCGRGQVGDTRTRCLHRRRWCPQSQPATSTTLSTFSIFCSSLDSSS